MIGKTKMTVPNTSVGADEEQPSTKSSKASITYLSDKSNLRTINLQEYGKQDRHYRQYLWRSFMTQHIHRSCQL